MSRSGSSTARIVIKNYPGESPILDGGTTKGNGVDFNANSYITWRGFEVRRYASQGFFIASSSVIPVNNEISGNYIHDIGPWVAGAVAGHGVLVKHAKGTKIAGNRIARTVGYGIVDYGYGWGADDGSRSGYSLIQGNDISRGSESLIFMSNAVGDVVDGNYLHFENTAPLSKTHTDDIQVAFETMPANSGIVIRNNRTMPNNNLPSGKYIQDIMLFQAAGIQIYNNVIGASSQGSTGMLVGSCPNAKIYNNTIANAQYWGIWLFNHSGHGGSANARVFNNLIYKAGTNPTGNDLHAINIDLDSTVGYKGDYNVFHTYHTGPGQYSIGWGGIGYTLAGFRSTHLGLEGHSLEQPVNLVDEANAFRLNYGSPAIDRGSPSPTAFGITAYPSGDKDGGARLVGSSIDIGAYEYKPPAAQSTGDTSGLKSALTNDANADSRSDAIALYDYGSGLAGSWVFRGIASTANSAKTAFTSSAWWMNGGFDVARSQGVTGDFNGDGKTDVLALYKEGEQSSSMKLFTSTGTSYLSPRVVFYSGSWTANNTKLASGDFDGDKKDEILAFYTYGGSNTGVFLFKQNQDGSFGCRQVYYSSGWNWANTKLVTVKDGSKAKVIAAYAYTWSTTAFWTFELNSQGALINPAQSFYSTSWNDARAKFVSGDVNGDGRGDIIALYDYGNITAKAFIFKSIAPNAYASPQTIFSSSDWNCGSSTLIQGDFNADGKGDAGVVYDYGGAIGLWIFASNGSTLTPPVKVQQIGGWNNQAARWLNPN